MSNTEKAVKNYQCSGCILGSDPKDGCFKKSATSACGAHVSGTMILGAGKLFLGMPKGFNRIGPIEKFSMQIFKDEAEFKSFFKSYDKLNIPVWKHRTSDGHTLVRGMSPRTNFPFLHVFLYDCLKDIDCTEITEADMEDMD